MKKKNKSTKNNVPVKTKLMHLVVKVRATSSAHGVFIMFLLAGIAIGLALYRSNSYLTPTRDEAKYQELSSATNYGKIDEKVVSKLQESLNDIDVTINANLAPNRKNPFSE